MIPNWMCQSDFFTMQLCQPQKSIVIAFRICLKGSVGSISECVCSGEGVAAATMRAAVVGAAVLEVVVGAVVVVMVVLTSRCHHLAATATTGNWSL